LAAKMLPRPVFRVIGLAEKTQDGFMDEVTISVLVRQAKGVIWVSDSQYVDEMLVPIGSSEKY